MKHLYSLTLLIALLTCSCDYLDYDETSGYDKDDMFIYFERTKGMLTNVYSYLPSDFGSIDGAMRDAASDDADYVWSTSSIHRFNDGGWSAIDPLDDQWSHFYEGIRAANLFLENYQIDFPNIEWNSDYEELIKQYVNYPLEARFLRAFYHFELAKRYNNIPLLDRTYTPEEVNDIAPSSFDDVVRFIADECDAIAPELPVSYASLPGSETGRVTQGAALALKARALLYAASKLHNPEGDKQKWYDAASAAAAVIALADKTGCYSLVDEVPVNNLASKELILECRVGDSNSFEKLNFPIGYEGGRSGTTPTQNLVDAFEIDGEAFDWDNPEHVQGIYNEERRDPRLFATVLHNKSVWKGSVVETFQGGRNAQPLEGASRTSYYLKKYVKEDVTLTDGRETNSRHVWVLFRYSEVLLNYAEALYEYGGSETFTDDLFALSPLDAVNRIRERAGTTPLAVSDFTTQLRAERRVELAFEDHRFWDVRRWMIGPETTDIYGVKITGKGANPKYERVLIEKRIWEDKMYFYPIPNSEIFKNHKLVQNTGW